MFLRSSRFSVSWGHPSVPLVPVPNTLGVEEVYQPSLMLGGGFGEVLHVAEVRCDRDFCAYPNVQCENPESEEAQKTDTMGLKSASILEDCYLFPDTGHCKKLLGYIA